MKHITEQGTQYSISDEIEEEAIKRTLPVERYKDKQDWHKKIIELRCIIISLKQEIEKLEEEQRNHKCSDVVEEVCGENNTLTDKNKQLIRRVNELEQDKRTLESLRDLLTEKVNNLKSRY